MTSLNSTVPPTTRPFRPLPALLILLGLGVAPAAAHETDQFTVPPEREFAEVGPLVSRWMYDAVKKGMDETNARIKSAVESGSESALKRAQSDTEIVRAVNSALPWAMDVIEGWEKQLDDRDLWARYPGRVVIYEHQYDNILKDNHFFLDPRQFMRIWLSGTFKCFGTFMGSDKIGHFTDMGMNYWREYDKARAEGKPEAECVRRAVHVGEEGLLFSERGMVGYMTAGAYSNGDLAANYLGFLFYRNLTDPVMLKGQEHKPLLVRDGPYWKIAPHIDRDTFFSAFVSDHFDEALNPSHFEDGMRPHVRAQVEKRAAIMLEQYRDEHGQRRPRQWFATKHEDLRSYYGQPYGHYGPREQLVRIADVAFPAPNPADPAARDFAGRSALHALAESDDLAAVKALLARKADPNLPVRSDEPFNGDWGSTPLMFAARAGHAQVAAALLDAGAAVNARNDLGVTALHRAVGAGDVATVDLLLARRANPNLPDSRGLTPLHWAARNKYKDPEGPIPGARQRTERIVSALLRTGADANALDRDGRTPLHRCAEAGTAGVAALLLGAGARPGAADRLGVTPLHVAAARDYGALARLLIERGAPAGARDQLGSTPLHDAARNSARSVAALLLHRGADPAVTDAFGQRPLDLAKRANDTALAQVLTSPSITAAARPAAAHP